MGEPRRYCYAVGLILGPRSWRARVRDFGDEELVSWRCMSTLRLGYKIIHISNAS